MAKLSGMKAIAAHENRSEPTVLSWIKHMEYPAIKLGGIWESTTEDSEKWHKKRRALSSGFAPNKKEDKKAQTKIETLV
jgi:hypothetical protein